MTQHAYAHGALDESHGHHEDHGPGFYVKIWAILLVLLIISILGPMFGNVWLTLATAFGIAVVKAGIVATYFMHLNIEKKYIWYLLYAMLLAMVVLFMGVYPDVMQHKGANWINTASHNLVEQYRESPPEHSAPAHAH